MATPIQCNGNNNPNNVDITNLVQLALVGVLHGAPTIFCIRVFVERCTNACTHRTNDYMMCKSLNIYCVYFRNITPPNDENLKLNISHVMFYQPTRTTFVIFTMMRSRHSTRTKCRLTKNKSTPRKGNKRKMALAISNRIDKDTIENGHPTTNAANFTDDGSTMTSQSKSSTSSDARSTSPNPSHMPPRLLDSAFCTTSNNSDSSVNSVEAAIPNHRTSVESNDEVIVVDSQPPAPTDNLLDTNFPPTIACLPTGTMNQNNHVAFSGCLPTRTTTLAQTQLQAPTPELGFRPPDPYSLWLLGLYSPGAGTGPLACNKATIPAQRVVWGGK